jgi:hypothetical protein
MSGVTWLADTFAAIMLATSAYCLTRPLAARRWKRQMHHDVNVSHVLMGVAMAGMLVPALNVISNHVWEVVFGVFMLWFATRSACFVGRHGLRGLDDDQMHHVTHYLTHLLMSGGMIYMYLVVLPSMGESALSVGSMEGGVSGIGAKLAIVTLLFIVALFGSAVWHADGLTRFAVATAGSDAGGGTSADRGDTGGTGASPAYAADIARVPGTLFAAAGGTVLAPTTVTGTNVPRRLAPRLEMGCHIAMCVTMGYMLILLL